MSSFEAAEIWSRMLKIHSMMKTFEIASWSQRLYMLIVCQAQRRSGAVVTSNGANFLRFFAVSHGLTFLSDGVASLATFSETGVFDQSESRI
jgi:hypothetical protein